MMAGKGCLVRSKLTRVSQKPGGQKGATIMKDDIWIRSLTWRVL